jgi:hypothetical protein
MTMLETLCKIAEERKIEVEYNLKNQFKFLKWLGFTEGMIKHRFRWIYGYQMYHQCTWNEAIIASMDRYDSSSDYHMRVHAHNISGMFV